MNGIHDASRASPMTALFAALLLAASAQAAGPAAPQPPAMRIVNTPAGPMLVLPQPPAPSASASAPATEVQSTPAGPMLVLKQPGAARPATLAARSLAASPLPAGVHAEASANGAQVLVLAPTTAKPGTSPGTAARPIVEIDPAKPGTRPGDTPRNDVLYRPQAAASAAKR